MKISGFTIIKNAIINDYPIVEAITSILPIIDEVIVLVGDSNDDTKKLVQGINNDKIKIFDSIWDQSLRKGLYFRISRSIVSAESCSKTIVSA